MNNNIRRKRCLWLRKLTHVAYVRCQSEHGRL